MKACSFVIGLLWCQVISNFDFSFCFNFLFNLFKMFPKLNSIKPAKFARRFAKRVLSKRSALDQQGKFFNYAFLFGSNLELACFISIARNKSQVWRQVNFLVRTTEAQIKRLCRMHKFDSRIQKVFCLASALAKCGGLKVIRFNQGCNRKQAAAFVEAFFNRLEKDHSFRKINDDLETFFAKIIK